MNNNVNMGGMSDYLSAIEACSGVPSSERRAYFDNVIVGALRRQSDELVKSVGMEAARQWYRNEYDRARCICFDIFRG